MAQLNHQGALFAVADGMGGPSCGEVASAAVIRAVPRMLDGKPRPTAKGMIDGYTEARREIKREADRTGAHDMGTTLTVLWLDRVRVGTTLRALIGQVGDTRCYHVVGHCVTQLTWDHSEAERLIRAGRCTRKSPVGGHILNRTMDLNVHGPDPDLFRALLRPGDAMVLCSDGLYDLVDLEREDSPELRQLKRQIADARTKRELQDICDALVALANARGGHDNITVVIVKYFSVS